MDDRTRRKCEDVDVDGQNHFILFALKPVVWPGWWCTASSLYSTNKSFCLSSVTPSVQRLPSQHTSVLSTLPVDCWLSITGQTLQVVSFLPSTLVATNNGEGGRRPNGAWGNLILNSEGNGPRGMGGKLFSHNWWPTKARSKLEPHQKLPVPQFTPSNFSLTCRRLPAGPHSNGGGGPQTPDPATKGGHRPRGRWDGKMANNGGG